MHRIILLSCIFSCSMLCSAQDLERLSYIQLDSLMYIEYNKNDFPKALTYVEAAKEKAFIEFGQLDSLYASYTANVGFFYDELGDKKKAEKLYLEALEIREKLFGENHASFATTLNNLALLYTDIGLYEKALSSYKRSRDIDAKSIGTKHPTYARTLNNLAGLYSRMGDAEKAEALWLEALGIYKRTIGTNNQPYTETITGLGVLYKNKRQLKKAEPFYLEALEIDQRLLGETHPKVAISSSNIAIFYQETKDFEIAESYYKKSIAIWAKIVGKQHPRYAKAISNLGTLYREMNKIDKGLALVKEALKIVEVSLGKRHPSYLLTLNNLASYESLKGNYEASASHYQEVIRIRAAVLGKKHPDYAFVLTNMAGLYLDTEVLDSAYAYCLASIYANIKEDIVLTQGQWSRLRKATFSSNYELNRSLKMMINILKKQHAQDGSYQLLEELYELVKVAITLIERQRTAFTNEEDKLLNLQNNTFFAQEAIRINCLLNKKEQLTEAFSFAELNKSILLADAVKGKRAQILGDLPDSLITKELNLKNELKKLKIKQQNTQNKEQNSSLNQEISALQLSIDAFLNSIKDKYPKYHQLKYENITAKSTAIQALLDDKTAMLEYLLTDSMVYLFVVTKTDLELVQIKITKKELNHHIKELRSALSDYNMIVKKENKAISLYVQEAFWFYKTLLKKALEKVAVQKLIIITDGELGHLPFEAFLVEPNEAGTSQKEKVAYATDLHYLLKDYAVSYNYSASLWKDIYNKKVQQSSGKMLACASTYPKSSFWRDSAAQAIKTLRTPHTYELRTLLGPLPAAQTEIAELAKTFQGDFLWNDSTNEAFFKAYAQDYGIIHLAMHGILDDKNPMLSSLAFTENSDTKEDNFLQAYEIARLGLNAQLVVLSACETGFGVFEQGEGIISLARSFMYAGVPSLVVSLWQVNDRSTAIIMNNFYNNLAEGMTKSTALRQAKLSYLSRAKKIMGHPAFWSPFIQLGDDRPIVLKRIGNWQTWLGGMATFCLLGGVIMYFIRRKKGHESV